MNNPSQRKSAGSLTPMPTPYDSLVPDEIAILKAKLLTTVARNFAATRDTVSEAESLAREAHGSRPMMKAVVDANSENRAEAARRAAGTLGRPVVAPSRVAANESGVQSASITDRFRALR